MPNIDGGHYFLTVLAPIQVERMVGPVVGWSYSHQHQLALGRGGRIDLFIQTDAMNGAEHGGDMSVGQGASDLDWLPSRKEEFTAQDAAQGVDLSSRPGREIGEGTFVDLPAFAPGFAEQDGGWRVAVGDRLHVHGDMLSNTKHNGKNYSNNYMGTYFYSKNSVCHSGIFI